MRSQERLRAPRLLRRIFVAHRGDEFERADVAATASWTAALLRRFRIATGRPNESGAAAPHSKTWRLAARFLKTALTAWAILTAWTLAAQPVPTDPAALKARAYELHQQQKFTEAAEQFRAYIERNPDDARATLDYALLLSQLKRHADAAKVLEGLHARFPTHEGAYFRLGVEYVTLERFAEADRVFTALQQSASSEMATAAREALAKLRADLARAERLRLEQRVFTLAGEFRHAGVVAAVNELEKQGELAFPLEMQRLYAWSSLREYAVALDRANTLTNKYPDSIELSLFRADIFAQQGRKQEAAAIWRQVIAKHPNTAAAAEADRRLQVEAPDLRPPPTPAEERIYALARQQKHREVVAAINDLENEKPLPWAMEMQRLYAWQALGQRDRALQGAAQMARKNPDAADLALLQSDLLINAHRWQEASDVLKRIKQKNPGRPVAEEAQKRLDYLPAVANLDKWQWGEAYATGDYHDRFGTLVGYGFVREGTFVPSARWIQPYAEFRFGVDTESTAKNLPSIYYDNFVGFFGGARLQPFAAEYLFFYAQAGMSQDLLDRRQDGDWEFDYQVGIYGYKSWGPGVTLHRTPPEGAANYTNYVRSLERKGGKYTDLFFWRGDWWVDVGADFSWYGRYDNWIGYGQAREGLRLVQFGPNIGFDVYALQGISWDLRGNYFDNLFELGPGARILWLPRRNWQVVARLEYVGGWYFGRDDLNNRGGRSSSYDDLRAGLSVGVRW